MFFQLLLMIKEPVHWQFVWLPVQCKQETSCCVPCRGTCREGSETASQLVLQLAESHLLILPPEISLGPCRGMRGWYSSSAVPLIVWEFHSKLQPWEMMQHSRRGAADNLWNEKQGGSRKPVWQLIEMCSAEAKRYGSWLAFDYGNKKLWVQLANTTPAKSAASLWLIPVLACFLSGQNYDITIFKN